MATRRADTRAGWAGTIAVVAVVFGCASAPVTPGADGASDTATSSDTGTPPPRDARGPGLDVTDPPRDDAGAPDSVGPPRDGGRADATTPGAVWHPRPGTSWQWQLSGTIDTSFAVQMYDIDLFETP